jgi:hypothetical protein
MTFTCVWLFLGMLLAGADKSTGPRSLSTVSGLTLNSQVTGKCPSKTVVFKGSFTSTGPVTITYQWIKGTGGRETVGKSSQEKFTGGGKHSIETTWPISGSFSGWMTFKIVKPVSLQSNRASFNVKCGK